MTPTAAIVLGLLERLGEASAYDLKRAAEQWLGNFWSTPHSQVYRTTNQLAADGLLAARTETTAGGRARTLYQITRPGRAALAAWRREPLAALPELRDPALLKLHFGADLDPLAAAQLTAHQGQLAAYEARQREDTGAQPRGPWLTLRAGILHEAVWVQFWSELLSSETAAPTFIASWAAEIERAAGHATDDPS